MIRRCLLSAFLTLFAAGVAAQAPAGGQQTPANLPAALKVTLEPVETTVGGRVRAELTLVWMGEEPSDPPRFPTWGDTWGTAEVLDVSQVEAFTDQSGRYVYRQRVELTAFQVGEVSVPTVTVAVPLAERTVEVTSPQATRFTVLSVLPQEGDADAEAAELEPKPLAPPMGLGRAQTLFLAAMATLGLLLAASLLVLLRRLAAHAALRPEAAGEVPDPLALLPPLEELTARFGRLDPAAGAEPVHTGLSTALRTYLGRRLEFNALESTTSEIQRRLVAGAAVGELGQQAVQLLRRCDQVKFARLTVAADVCASRLDEARRLAGQIEDRLRPRQVEAGEATGAPGREEAA